MASSLSPAHSIHTNLKNSHPSRDRGRARGELMKPLSPSTGISRSLDHSFVPSFQSDHERVIAHFDLDAFYVGCERELNPSSLADAPVAVMQYNPHARVVRQVSSDQVEERLVVRPGSDGISGSKKTLDVEKNGSLIAVSYEARAAGVKRNDRGFDAVKKCPELRVVQVPVRHGKADLTMYRDASQRVLNVLISSIKKAAGVNKEAISKMRVEKASIDEIYIDMTSVALDMANKIMRLRDNQEDLVERVQSDWDEAMFCTTVGGIETLSDQALAANGLSKEELRRGSHLQVIDSSFFFKRNKEQIIDDGSKGWWHRCLVRWTDMEIKLACGAVLAAKARSDVSSAFSVQVNKEKKQVFTLSAGISSNKTLAKLASGLKKPNRQTLINPTDDDALQKLFHPLPIGRIRGLGGKFGIEVAEKLKVSTLGDLAKLPFPTIEKAFPPSFPNHEKAAETTAQFLYSISRGVCLEEVVDRTKPKSIASSKTFHGQLALDPKNIDTIRKWCSELCAELTERLDGDQKENARTPKSLIVSVKLSGIDKSNAISRTIKAPRQFNLYVEEAVKTVQQIVERAVGASSLPLHNAKITTLSLSASSFIDIASDSSSIMAALRHCGQKKGCPSEKYSLDMEKEKAERGQNHRKKVSIQELLSRKVGEKHAEINGKMDSTKDTDCSSSSVNKATSFPANTPIASLGLQKDQPPENDVPVFKKDIAISFDKKAGSPVLSRLSVLTTTSHERLGQHSVSTNKQKRSSMKEVMECWLVKDDVNDLSSKQKRHDANIKETSPRLSPENGGIAQFFGNGNKSSQNSKPKRHYQPAAWNEVDQTVLMELPEDIREGIKKDMQCRGQKHNKRSRIDKFFLAPK